jgi:hypothetical protein
VIYKVDFKGGGDGVDALYINGMLHKYGDYYHDKIGEWIEGFLGGIKYAGINYTFKTIQCKPELVEEVSENGGVPPKSLSDAVDIDPISNTPH